MSISTRENRVNTLKKGVLHKLNYVLDEMVSKDILEPSCDMGH